MTEISIEQAIGVTTAKLFLMGDDAFPCDAADIAEAVLKEHTTFNIEDGDEGLLGAVAYMAYDRAMECDSLDEFLEYCGRSFAKSEVQIFIDQIIQLREVA